MLDKSDIPKLLDDTQVDVNPYEITDIIWNLIEEYFTSKYGVELTESFPIGEVSKPTIVSLIHKRTPGRDTSKIHGKGYNFVKFIKKSPDGYVHERHIQQQEIIIEYTVYATSTAEVKRIAWDLERAVLETVGIIQAQVEGFQLFFDQQTMDSSMLWKQQDELIKRTLRFKALMPIQFTKLVPELRYIDIVETWGNINTSGTVFTRESSDKVFYVTTSSGQIVANIRNVFLKEVEYPYAWAALLNGTDFYLRKNSNNVVFLEWNDEYGRVPSVGDEFRVDYDLSQNVRGRTIKPQ